MAWLFGDSFDPYAAIADAGANFWDTSTGWGLNSSGRFTGSKCFTAASTQSATVANLTKAVGSNDATYHVVFGYEQTSTLSGTTAGNWITFYDGTTAQCSIVFQSGGNILLTSGASSGTTLDTYTGAIGSANVWTGIEIEVTINNATGSWHIRKNGNASDDHAATGLNTRGGTANNYGNKIGVGIASTLVNQKFDDFLWFSTGGSAPNTWVGDIRATWQAPAGNSSQQFSPLSPSAITIGTNGTGTDTTSTARYSPITATYDGTIGSLVVNMSAAATGNLKCTIFNDAGTTPGTILASATTLVNPVLGANTITFPSPPTVVQNAIYWIGFSHDVSMTFKTLTGSGDSGTGVAYASFPSSTPSVSTSQARVNMTVNITPTLNYQQVNETAEDGLTSYLFDSTVNDADFYTIAALNPTPIGIIATQTRLFGEKDNAGARTGAVQVQSGGTTVQATHVLNTSFEWITRLDTVDPNTAAAWTPTGVNAMLIGPQVNA